MNIVHVGGAKGVGKTSVLQELRKDLRESNSNIEVLFTSVEFGNLSTVRYGKTLANLQTEERNAIQKEFMFNVKNMSFNIIILDSHYVDVTPKGIIPLLQKEVWSDFTCHIILEADPQTILRQRISDTKRKRQLDIKRISMEIEAERNQAYIISKETGATTYVLNSHGTLKETKEAIKDILRKEFRKEL